MSAYFVIEEPRLRFSKVLERALAVGFKRIPAVAVAVGPWIFLASFVLVWALASSLNASARSSGLDASASRLPTFSDLVFFCVMIALFAPIAVGAINAVFYGDSKRVHRPSGPPEWYFICTALFVSAVNFLLVDVVGASFYQSVFWIWIETAANEFLAGLVFILILGVLSVISLIATIRLQQIQTDAVLNERFSFEGFDKSKNNVWAIFFIGFVVALVIYAATFPLFVIGGLFSGGSSMSVVGVIFLPTGLTMFGIVAASVYASTLVSIYVHLGGRAPNGHGPMARDLGVGSPEPDTEMLGARQD